jgi:predicted MFS family arabinose efflux permease
MPHISVVLVGTAVAFSLLGDMAVYTILPVYYQKLDLIPFQVGILLSANRWIRLLTNHLAERLTRRFKPLYLLVAVLIIGAGLAAFYSSFPPFSLFLLARIMWGLCWSFLRHIGIMTSLTHASTRDTGQVLGFYNGIARVGSTAGVLFGGLLFDSVGFSSTFLIFACISLLGIPAAIAALKGKPRFGSISRSESPVDVEIKRIIPLLFCGLAVGCVGPGIITSTMGYILHNQMGDSVLLGRILIGIATVTGIVLAMRHILNTLAAPLIGALLDRIGHDRGALIFSILGALVLFFTALFTGIIIFVIVMTVMVFACSTALNIAFSAEAGRRGSKTYALYASASDLGSALGPVLGWTIFEVISSPVAVFAIGSIFYMLAALLSKKAFSGNRKV